MATARSFTYAAKETNLSLDADKMSGAAKGSFIEVSFTSDAVDLEVGSDGLGQRSIMSDQSAKIVVRLMANSPFNKILTSMLKADNSTGDGVRGVSITDPAVGDLFTGERCWVRTRPKTFFKGEKNEVKEWTLECDDLHCDFAPNT